MSTGIVKERLTLRRFVESDIAAGLVLSRAVGWAHRRHDWKLALRTGIGFLVEHSGVAVGTGFCWQFGLDQATIGLVIVEPAYQGLGIGRMLMDQLIETVGDRTTFLNATSSGAPLYRKLGFEACGVLGQYHRKPTYKFSSGTGIQALVRSAIPDDLPAISELLLAHTGFDRTAILPELLAVGGAMLIEERGKPVAVALSRPSGGGHVIGPLAIAASAPSSYAQALIDRWVEVLPNQSIRMDVPSYQQANDLLADCGFSLVSTATRMVRSTALATNCWPCRQGCYGVISQAMD